MTDFTYYTPTKVIFSLDAEKQAGRLIKEFKGSKVLIHYGSERVKKTGLLNRVIESLDQNKIFHIELGGAQPNPRLSLVRKAIKIVKDNDIDFILAVGGGSAIDSSKAIAIGSVSENDVWDFYSNKLTPTKALPLGVVLTIAAAGSEMSSGSVITNDETLLKRSTGNECMISKFSLLNPQLTTTLPPYQTASGAFDAAMHSIERYFCKGHKAALTQSLGESIIKTIFDQVKIALKEPENLDARGNLMWASSLSHNSLTSSGNPSRGDWAPHKIEHELGGMFDCAHGAGIAAIFCSWARYVYKEQPETFATFGYNVFNLEKEEDVDKAANNMINKMEEFIKEINMPTSIPELLGFSLNDDQIELLASKGTDNGKLALGDILPLKKEDFYNIYKNANN